MNEYKPTEYVVDFGDCRSNQFVRLNMALIERNSAKLCERIVRCRDCIWYIDDPDMYTSRPFCDYLDGIHFKPDDFCSCGKRKKDKAI